MERFDQYTNPPHLSLSSVTRNGEAHSKYTPRASNLIVPKSVRRSQQVQIFVIPPAVLAKSGVSGLIVALVRGKSVGSLITLFDSLWRLVDSGRVWSALSVGEARSDKIPLAVGMGWGDKVKF